MVQIEDVEYPPAPSSRPEILPPNSTQREKGLILPLKCLFNIFQMLAEETVDIEGVRNGTQFPLNVEQACSLWKSIIRSKAFRPWRRTIAVFTNEPEPIEQLHSQVFVASTGPLEVFILARAGSSTAAVPAMAEYKMLRALVLYLNNYCSRSIQKLVIESQDGDSLPRISNNRYSRLLPTLVQLELRCSTYRKIQDICSGRTPLIKHRELRSTNPVLSLRLDGPTFLDATLTKDFWSNIIATKSLQNLTITNLLGGRFMNTWKFLSLYSSIVCAKPCNLVLENVKLRKTEAQFGGCLPQFLTLKGTSGAFFQSFPPTARLIMLTIILPDPKSFKKDVIKGRFRKSSFLYLNDVHGLSGYCSGLVGRAVTLVRPSHLYLTNCSSFNDLDLNVIAEEPDSDWPRSEKLALIRIAGNTSATALGLRRFLEKISRKTVLSLELINSSMSVSDEDLELFKTLTRRLSYTAAL